MQTSTKLNLIQKVAIVWLTHVDGYTLWMFNSLKRLSAPVRYLLYIVITTSTIFTLHFIGTLLSAFMAAGMMADIVSFVGGFLSTFIGVDIAVLFEDFIVFVVKLIGNIIFYGASAGMILVLTLESVYMLNVSEILEQNKARQKEIREKKLQKWRLRNMNISIRIFLYFLIFVVLFFVMNSSAQGAFFHLFGTADLTNPLVQSQVKLFINEFDKMQQWFTLIYVVGVITLDYFVSKKRDQRKLEVQNEAV